jgi:hypothetical protein
MAQSRVARIFLAIFILQKEKIVVLKTAFLLTEKANGFILIK